MRKGWKEVEGRGDERRFERTDNPNIYVRIGGDDTISDEEMAERIDDAMIAADAGISPKGRGDAPAGALKGD